MFSGGTAKTPRAPISSLLLIELPVIESTVKGNLRFIMWRIVGPKNIVSSSGCAVISKTLESFCNGRTSCWPMSEDENKRAMIATRTASRIQNDRLRHERLLDIAAPPVSVWWRVEVEGMLRLTTWLGWLKLFTGFVFISWKKKIKIIIRLAGKICPIMFPFILQRGESKGVPRCSRSRSAD